MKQEIQPAEHMIWSWGSVRQHAVISMFQGMGIGALVGLVNAVPYYQQPEVFIATFAYSLSIGFTVGIAFMLICGFTRSKLDPDIVIKPNQGIRNSLSNSLRLGLFAGVSVGIIIYVFYGFVMRDVLTPGFASDIPANSNVVFGASFGLAIAYLFWLINGGFAALQHYVLRFALWRQRFIPVRYTRFLDYSYERILMRRIGGGYTFLHKTLLDYFADLRSDPSAGVSVTGSK